MTGHYVLQAIFILFGIFIIVACVCDWDWFFKSQNARMIVNTTGRKRARLYYGLLGILLIATGVFFFLSLQGWL